MRGKKVKKLHKELAEWVMRELHTFRRRNGSLGEKTARESKSDIYQRR